MIRHLSSYTPLTVLLMLAVLGCVADGAAGGTLELSREREAETGFLLSSGGRYTLTPIESVSMNEAEVWRDNRLRAYLLGDLSESNGFLLFDVSGIPDGSTVVTMTLRCYLENNFQSPYNNPIVDVYYCAVDGWERNTVPAGALSHDTLLADDIPFGSYVAYYDFSLDVPAHDWSGDLVDDQICIGFRDDAGYASFVYFFGAYGEPVGPPPELTILTSSTVEGRSWTAIKALYR